jgi:soluble lytic murein transglycosylase-like protein
LLIFRGFASIALVLLTAGSAAAQIYSWHDANGNLVLSDRPLRTSEHTFVVPEATSVRTTRPAPLERGRLYDDLIEEHARLNSIRSDLVRAVVQVESGFNPYAVSPKGALGLMQLMPATAQQFGVKNPFDPNENVRAGVAYLRQLLDRYENDERLALAAYNAGPGAVDRHGQNVPPYRETRDYVARINKMASGPIQPRGTVIYKTVEIVEGRPVTRYSDSKPTTGAYEVISTPGAVLPSLCALNLR